MGPARQLLMPSAGVDDQEQKQLRRRDPRGKSVQHADILRHNQPHIANRINY